MKALDLTIEEREILLTWSQSRRESRWGWFLSVLGPISVFGFYGLIANDFVALAVAFGALISWTAFNTLNQGPTDALYRSISRKILAFHAAGLDAQETTPPSDSVEASG